ncbi:MAG: hypothetical protein ACK5SI_12035, partial [Planctomycetia bacterium]
PSYPLVQEIQPGQCFNVASEELMRSWRRTEGFLLDARSHFSEAAEGICEEDLREFEDFLNHNELELALDMLEAAFEKSSFETGRVLELMALAAASMGLFERQQRYDRELTNARGWKYETVLPP